MKLGVPRSSSEYLRNIQRFPGKSELLLRSKGSYISFVSLPFPVSDSEEFHPSLSHQHLLD